MFLLYFLPKNLCSYFFGLFASIRFPRIIQGWVNKVFCWITGITIDPKVFAKIEHYASIQELFTRPLLAGGRTISQSALVSPADGILTEFKAIASDQEVVQVKGITYSLRDLFKIKDPAQKIALYGVIYLSPRHYHRVHSPVRGMIRRISSIPGKLWPVNSWGLKHIPQLFVENERMVFEIEGDKGGRFWLAMVGALNVGGIHCSKVSGQDCNSFKRQVYPLEVHRLNFSKAQGEIEAGEELGVFKLGSTVVFGIDFDTASRLKLSTASLPKEVLMGENLLA